MEPVHGCPQPHDAQSSLTSGHNPSVQPQLVDKHNAVYPHPAVTRSEVPTLDTTRMDLELSERSQIQQATAYVIPCTGNVQNRPNHRDRLGREMAVTDDRDWTSFGGGETVLELDEVVVAQRNAPPARAHFKGAEWTV